MTGAIGDSPDRPIGLAPQIATSRVASDGEGEMSARSGPLVRPTHRAGMRPRMVQCHPG